MSQFCYWQVFKDVDFFLLLVIGFGAILILFYILRQCLKIIKFFKRIDKKFVLIYFFCLLWGLLYVLKIAFLVIEYMMEVKDAASGYSMFEISQIFCIIDTLPTFFLMYLLILIPYFWLKNITIFLERMRRDQRKDRWIIRFFNIYVYLRLFLYVGIAISELAIKEESLVDTLCDSLIMIILCQVFMSLLLLCYGLVKMFRNFSSLNVQDEQSKRKFIKEYVIMILCSFIRFAMDFYFIIYEKTQMEERNCLEFRKNDFVQFLVYSERYTTLYIILGEVLMHLAPIVTILSIYRVDFDVVLEDSFIGSKTENSQEGMHY